MKKLSIIFLFILSIQLNSQTKTNGIGLSYGHFWAINDVEFAVSNLVVLTMNSFVSQSDYLGLTYEFKLPVLNNFSVLTNFYYNKFKFSQEKNGDKYPNLVADSLGNQKVVYSVTSHNAIGDYSLITLDILPKYNFPNSNLSIYAGASISKYISSIYEYTYNIVAPVNAKFSKDPDYTYRNNDQTLVFYNDKIPEYNNYRIGIKIGASYDFKINDISISPYLNFDYSLTELANNYVDCSLENCFADLKNPHWKVHYLNTGIDVKYWF